MGWTEILILIVVAVVLVIYWGFIKPQEGIA